MTTLSFNPNAKHDSRMAVPVETFDAMKATLQSFVTVKGANTFNRHLADIRKEGKSKDPVTRVIWDYFWAIRPGVIRRLGAESHIDAFSNLKDAHIESALRRLIEVTE